MVVAARVWIVATVAACGRVDFDPAPASGVTATFGARDTYLDATNPTFNYGGATGMHVDSDQIALVQFDVSALPAAAVVEAASLRIWTQTDPSTGTFEVHRVLEAWDEGAMDGAPGAANYTERMAGVPWSASYLDAAVLATFAPAANDSPYDIAVPIAEVTGWLADPGANFGLAITTQATDGVYLRSSAAGDPTRRPVLTITYSP